MSIATLIRLTREQRGVSQRKLADLIGVSTRTLLRIETGEMIPDDELVENIATCLRLKKCTLINMCEVERGIQEYVEPACESVS